MRIASTTMGRASRSSRSAVAQVLLHLGAVLARDPVDLALEPEHQAEGSILLERPRPAQHGHRLGELAMS